jgi:2-oxoisovalerate dehydrogenase E1 component alpha subunit
VVDGNDVLACYAAMKTAHDRARAGGGPTLIECKTYRYLPHTSDDDDKSYRTREEVEEAHHHDPIDLFAGYLRDHGVADGEALDEMRANVKSELDRQIAQAWEAPDPEPASALRHVYAEDP